MALTGLLVALQVQLLALNAFEELTSAASALVLMQHTNAPVPVLDKFRVYSA